MSAINSSIYNEIEISAESTTGEGITVDLRLGVVKFNYFEDLFSPTITAQLLVVSSGNATSEDGKVIETVYSGLPIRGGERVKINIAGNTKSNLPLKFDTPDTYLYVSNVSRQYSDGAKEIFTLDLVSREAITNETSRLSEKYKNDVVISDTVKKIIETKLASTIDDENLDQTLNTYPFFGNLKTPFHTLVWLASKSIPVKGLPGYFFYQTKDGFNFRSIESLIRNGKENPKYQYYERKYTESSRLVDTDDDTIISYNVSQNNDLLTKLMLGQFSSHIMEFDPLTGYFTTEEQGKFTLNDSTNQEIRFPKQRGGEVLETNEVESLGATPEIPVLLDDQKQNLGTLPSRLITLVADRGALQRDPSVERGGNVQPTQWQRQIISRYQLLFTQILNMIVPLNTNLVVGDIIRINFLNANMESKEHDRRQSGNYMIKSLCHNYDANQSITSLTLVRDSFGEISK